MEAYCPVMARQRDACDSHALRRLLLTWTDELWQADRQDRALLLLLLLLRPVCKSARAMRRTDGAH